MLLILHIRSNQSLRDYDSENMIMTPLTMNTIGTQFDFQSTDGKNLGTVIEGMEWVRISEKKIGKGKGKTVAAISVPVVGSELQSLYADALSTARKEMLTSQFRSGVKNVTVDMVSESAVCNWYAAQVFSSDAVGVWFDTEMSEYLIMNVCTAKTWNLDTATHTAEQTNYLAQKCAAYKAAFLECGSKFPKLAPEQRTELIRILDLNEMNGGIVDRIRDKLVVQVQAVETALGFN